MENTKTLTLTSQDQRKHTRLTIEGNAKLSTNYIVNKIAKCKNISEGGIYLETSFDKFEFPSTAVACLRNEEIKLVLEFDNIIVESSGLIKWSREILPSQYRINKEYGFGIEFLGISPQYLQKIKNYIRNNHNTEKRQKELLHFPLLINGIEIDTGRYEYQPYFEKILLEYSNTSGIIRNIKNGIFSENYDKYIYGKYCVGDEEQFQNAIKSAYEASKIFKTFDIDLRAKIIIDIHNKLIHRKDEFVKLLVIEGHPKKLAEWEVGGMITGTSPETVHFSRMNLDAFIGNDREEKIYLQRKPDGVVCLSTPKNAPSSISVIGVFALMAGNTIIVKPPLSIPISTIFFWKEIVFKSVIENGAPKGVVNIVIGNSQKILQSWLNSPFVNDIIYIGDSKKGIEVGNQIYAHGKKPILELSGNDKVFIWEDAPTEKATDALLQSFYGSAQICMVPKMAFIHENIFNDFIKVFTQKTLTLKPGLPSSTSTVLSPVGKISEFYKVYDNAIKNGGTVLCGGKRVNHFGAIDEKGLFIEPTIIVFEDLKISKDIVCLTEENFFPLLPIIKVTGKNNNEIFDKMIRFSEFDNYGLRISIWTGSEHYVDKFTTNIIPGGILRINSNHIDFSLFLSNNGGTGKTGGPFGEMSYIWQKTTHLQGISITKP
jgi:acyl-CoA reductase-like NAD-dependent aldehyde dehydrogenase